MAGKIVLVVFAIIGFLFFDTVYVSAVMNYAAQSEMNIYLLRAVRKLVVQKEYTDMDTAIKVAQCIHGTHRTKLIYTCLVAVMC